MKEIKKAIILLKDDLKKIQEDKKRMIFKIKELEQDKIALERNIGNTHSVNTMKEMGIIKEKIENLEKDLDFCINLVGKI